MCRDPKCGKKFERTRKYPPQHYCSPECQNRHAYRRWYDKHVKSKPS